MTLRPELRPELWTELRTESQEGWSEDDAVCGDGLEAEPDEAGDVAAAGDGGQNRVLVVGFDDGLVGEYVGLGIQQCQKGAFCFGPGYYVCLGSRRRRGL